VERTPNEDVDPVRYKVTNGMFSLDTSWTPAAVTNKGQEPGGSLIVMNDWIVGVTNTVPATGALTMFAIHQGDASKYYSVQPYLNDPVDPELAALFALRVRRNMKTTSHHRPERSWRRCQVRR
jgi:hypothetical protein